MDSISTSKLRQHRDKLIKGAIAVFFIAGSLLFWLGQDKPAPPKETMSDKAPLYDVTQAVDDKSFWLFKAQNQLTEQQKAQEKLFQELEELKKGMKPSEEVEALKARIEQLEQQTVELTAHKSQTERDLPEESTQPELSQNLYHYPIESNSPAANLAQASGLGSIFSESLNLSLSEQSKLPHIDSFIPPGTYTKAVLLSGVDVSAGVSSQATPKPVLLRLVDKGSLPNKAFGKMKDCRIIAAAFGDLSSERAYMRLEKLSCVQPDGHVIVTDIDGYVNGEDGKNGLRGRVVIRDTDVLTRGFLGGLLSGLGKATSQSYRSTSISPFGSISSSSAQGLDILKQAGGQGVGDAFELMAKYNIQRAEQYQPIIQISAGREVEVVFHSGSEFGEKKLRKAPLPTEASMVSVNNIYGENRE